MGAAIIAYTGLNKTLAQVDAGAQGYALNAQTARRRLALIGGSGGIGKALAPLLAEGFAVEALSSVDLDVTSPALCAELARESSPAVVVFAAVRNYDAMAHRTTYDAVQDQVSTTCHGLANVLRGCLPPMRQRKWGRVIFLSSVVARQPTPGAGIYGACKAFGEALIRTAAVENAGHGVTCNSIRMGYFDAGLKDRMTPEHQAAALETIPARRWGTVVELARVIRMIVETEYINGATIDLTGGL